MGACTHTQIVTERPVVQVVPALPAGTAVGGDFVAFEARPRQLITSTGEVIEADLIVWAAGVKGADFLSGLGLDRFVAGLFLLVLALVVATVVWLGLRRRR